MMCTVRVKVITTILDLADRTRTDNGPRGSGLPFNSTAKYLFQTLIPTFTLHTSSITRQIRLPFGATLVFGSSS